MSVNLMTASNEWATRPADERFWAIGQMREKAAEWRREAATARVRLDSLKVVPWAGDDGAALSGMLPGQELQSADGVADALAGGAGLAADLRLVGPSGQAAEFGWHSFGQLARHVGAPADYLRRLPAPIAAAALNSGLQSAEDARKPHDLLFRKNGRLHVRSLLSGDYARIWNEDVLARMEGLTEAGWQVPPARPAFGGQPGARPATEDDCLAFSRLNTSLAIQPGQMIAPAGLYLSDHDCFAFMVNEGALIEHRGETLARGFFVSNSEVGAGALKLTSFLYRAVCGNHIVWDAREVKQVKIVHRGKNGSRFLYGRQIERALGQYLARDTRQDCERLGLAMDKALGSNREEVVDEVFGRRRLLTKAATEAAYDLAIEQADTTGRGINPRSAWGLVQGVTRLSQREEHADKRVELERAAGKLLELAF